MKKIRKEIRQVWKSNEWENANTHAEELLDYLRFFEGISKIEGIRPPNRNWNKTLSEIINYINILGVEERL